MKILRWAVAVFLVLVSLATWVPRIQIAGVGPDLLLGLVFILALQQGPLWGIWTGFVLGLLVAVEQPAGLGVESMALSLAGLTAALGSNSLDRHNPLVQVFMLLLAALVAETVRVIWMAGSHPGSIPELWLRWAVPGAFYTALALPLLASGVARLLGRRDWLFGAA